MNKQKQLITFVTLFLTISFVFSKASQQDAGGFSVDLIHIDSPLSPVYNPTQSLADRHQNAFRRSMTWASRVLKMGSFSSKIYADIFTSHAGEYIMKIQIGTPPVQVCGSVTLLSDLTWIQCKPCKKCYKQVVPFFVPANSSTYKPHSCHSKACKSIGDGEGSCDTQNICQFKYSYEGGGATKGAFSTDTIWFGQTPVKDLSFGCVNYYDGPYDVNMNGLIGLGGDSISLLSQLKSVTTKGKFSYCLLPQTYDASNKTIKFHIGENIVDVVLGPNVVSTTLVKKYFKTYYYIHLIDVLVGNKSLSSHDDQTNINLDHVEYGNMLVDLGTLVTYLPLDIYNRFFPDMIKAVGVETVVDPRGSYDQIICFKDLNLERVPVVTFRLEGGDIKVPGVNMFVEVKKGVSCMTIAPAQDSLGLFGNMIQRNLMVGIDLQKQKVYFKPTDCTMV